MAGGRPRGSAEWKEHGDPRCRKGNYIPKKELRSILDGRGIGVAAFAGALGVDRSTMSGFLSGTRYMGDEKVVRAAHMLAVSPLDVLGLSGVGVDKILAVRANLKYNGSEVDRGRYADPLTVDVSFVMGEPVEFWPDETRAGDWRDPEHLAAELISYTLAHGNATPLDLMLAATP